MDRLNDQDIMDLKPNDEPYKTVLAIRESIFGKLKPEGNHINVTSINDAVREHKSRMFEPINKMPAANQYICYRAMLKAINRSIPRTFPDAKKMVEMISSKRKESAEKDMFNAIFEIIESKMLMEKISETANKMHPMDFLMYQIAENGISSEVRQLLWDNILNGRF